jgi:glutaminyl-peptide cyclotransferase
MPTRSGIYRAMSKSDRGRRLVIWAGAVVALVAGCSGGQPAASTETETPTGPAPVVTPVVLGEMPHDTSAWIEGLEFDGPNLYEGTGIAGKSEVRQLDPATGAVLRAAATPNNYYGEGVAVVGDRIWELTWQDGVAVEWDEATLRPLRDVPVDGEGWGLCHDGDRMIRSDGTDRLRFHDPQSFAETGSVNVTREGQPVRNLNELECVDGQVWANVWQTDMIVRIDPATGVVNAVVDATALAQSQGRNSERVLNGIAHIDGDEFLITGKYWPKMFRVRLDAPS